MRLPVLEAAFGLGQSSRDRLAGAVGVQRMSGEDPDADQAEDDC